MDRLFLAVIVTALIECVARRPFAIARHADRAAGESEGRAAMNIGRKIGLRRPLAGGHGVSLGVIPVR
jgi:hypothetical protein